MSMLLLFAGPPEPPLSGYGEAFLEAVADADRFVFYALSDEGPTLIWNFGTMTGMHGTAAGTPTFEEPAIHLGLDVSMGFSGDDHVDMPQGVIDGADPSYSVGAWIKTTGTGAMVIAQQRDAAAFLGEWVLQLASGGDAGKLRAWAVNTASATEFDFLSPGVVNDGNPHHVALSVDAVAGTATMFIDGVQVAQDATIAGGTYDDALNLYIGRDQRDNDKGFVGTISDVGVAQGVALDEDAWYELYAIGSATVLIDLPLVDDTLEPFGPQLIAADTDHFIDLPLIDGTSTPTGPVLIDPALLPNRLVTA